MQWAVRVHSGAVTFYHLHKLPEKSLDSSIVHYFVDNMNS